MLGAENGGGISTKFSDEKNSTKIIVDKNSEIRKKRNSSKKSISLDGVADETNNNNNNNNNNDDEEKTNSPNLKID